MSLRQEHAGWLSQAAWTQRLILVLLAGLIPSGCRGPEMMESARVPAVETRYPAQTVLENKKGDKTFIPQVGEPALRLGLAMQSGELPVHVNFASELGVAVHRELQLCGASLTVVPLTTLPPSHLATATPLSPIPTDNIITINFQDPMDTSPPPTSPNPLLMTPTPPVVGQILVLRVVEYHPYFPLRATIEVRLLDGETQECIQHTTATWSAEEYGLMEPKPKRKIRHRIFGEARPADPDPGHNSPRAFINEIALDVSQWYYLTTHPPAPEELSFWMKCNYWLFSPPPKFGPPPPEQPIVVCPPTPPAPMLNTEPLPAPAAQ